MTFSHVLLLFYDRSPAPVPFLARRAETRLRGGLTLIELMVAMAVTLLLMGAVVSLFGFLGDTISNSKSDIEMLDRLRQASELLQTDLTRLTLQPGPPQGGREQDGFLEWVEGGHLDDQTATSVPNVKDMLHFTIRSRDEPLTGKIDTSLVPIGGDSDNPASAQNVGVSSGSSVSAGTGGSLTNVVTAPGYNPGFSGRSRLGEVIWFVTVDPKTELGRLHRYQLLVAAGADLSQVVSGDVDGNGIDDLAEFASRNDVSARLINSGAAVVANSLEALAQRVNRRAHQDGVGFVPFYSFADTAVYPTELDVAKTLFMLDPSTYTDDMEELLLSRLRETIVLDNVSEFDVKAWDAGTPVGEPGTITLLDDDFSGTTLGQTYQSRLRRGDSGWKKGGAYGPSKWTDSGGKLSNSGGSTCSVHVHCRQRQNEATVAQVISGFACTGDKILLSFDYTMADPNERLYVHLWGYVENANPSSGSTWMMNLGASNGNTWESSGAVFDQYNLGKPPNGSFVPPAGVGHNAAVILTGGSGTYEGTFDLGEFTNAPNTLADYDYLVIGFARNERGYGNTSALTIDNLKLLATAEVPSGAFGDYVDLGGEALCLPAPGAPVPPTLNHSGFTPGLIADDTTPATYDSWSAAYVSAAADGYDNDAVGNPGYGIVDDLGEATATRAPYPVPLQGIQVRLSVETPSKTKRTVTIRQRFDN